MNKEELDRHRRMLIELSKELEQESKQLKERIDKAIEYIHNKDNWYVDVGIITKVYIEKEKLLEILGDKE